MPQSCVASWFPGEGDLPGLAPLEQVGVCKLGTAIRVVTTNREGELATAVLDGLGDPAGGLVGDRAVDGPAGGDVGHGQGEAELAEGVTPS